MINQSINNSGLINEIPTKEKFKQSQYRHHANLSFFRKGIEKTNLFQDIKTL